MVKRKYIDYELEEILDKFDDEQVLEYMSDRFNQNDILDYLCGNLTDKGLFTLWLSNVASSQSAYITPDRVKEMVGDWMDINITQSLDVYLPDRVESECVQKEKLDRISHRMGSVISAVDKQIKSIKDDPQMLFTKGDILTILESIKK